MRNRCYEKKEIVLSYKLFDGYEPDMGLNKLKIIK